MFNLLKKKMVPKKLWKNLVLLFQPKVKIKRLTKSQNRKKKTFINHTAYVEPLPVIGKEVVHTITSEMEFFNNNDEIWEDPSDEEGIPLSREVDVKAEEFINRCKEIWRLERQKSEEEFRERLARSA
ncbi:hypothetical protein ES319_A07G081700v1 [Gossypium barbadense]|uniref:Uncharacterized protein n=3 Tax=Gossypium TaxID=3633 RepID=A0ABR0P9V1_GOSAR|nr:hypothetical protein ES319_A07G081700v1 [Gossypium barbadense]KAK5817991.1 hypothetical protein PVK06_022921 [Gossypium arboreum]TYH09331.1 hypothetical protein ES288_A07G086300v1 [Gossypium darwinii]